MCGGNMKSILTTIMAVAFVWTSAIPTLADEANDDTTVALFNSYMKEDVSAKILAKHLLKDLTTLSQQLEVVQAEAMALDPLAVGNEKALEKIVELQFEIDEMSVEYNREAIIKKNKWRSRAGWTGLGIGVLASGAVTYYYAHKDAWGFIIGFIAIPAGSALGYSVGAGIGGYKAKAIPLATYGNLLDLDAQVHEDLLNDYTPLELFKGYMTGEMNANVSDVAESLIRAGDSFLTEWSSVQKAANRDYKIHAAGNARSKMLMLEHTLRMRIAVHNAEILRKMDKARLWGSIGGAVVGGLGTTALIKVKQGRYSDWNLFHSVWVASATVGAGTLGYFISPKVVSMFQDPMDMDSAFD
jgi:hypothetical protein